MLKKKREYEFTALKRFYLNENISIRLIEGTLDELVEKYKIDRKYLTTYIENINRESEVCLTEKSVSDKVQDEEQDINMSGEAEHVFENEFINKSPISEAVDLQNDNPDNEAILPHYAEDLDKDHSFSEKDSVREDDKEEDVINYNINRPEIDINEWTSKMVSRMVSKKTKSLGISEQDIEIEDNNDNVIRDENINQINNDDAINTNMIYNRFLGPDDVDHIKSYSYNSIKPYDQDFQMEHVVADEKAENKSVQSQGDHYESCNSIVSSSHILDEHKSEKSERSLNLKELDAKDKFEEKILEEKDEQVKNNWVVLKKEKTISVDHNDSDRDMFEDQIPESNSEKDILFNAGRNIPQYNNIETNFYNVFNTTDVQTDKKEDFCNYDEIIDDILNDTTILGNKPKKSSTSLKQIQTDTSKAKIDTINLPKSKLSKKNFDSENDESAISNIISKKSSKKIEKGLQAGRRDDVSSISDDYVVKRKGKYRDDISSIISEDTVVKHKNRAKAKRDDVSSISDDFIGKLNNIRIKDSTKSLTPLKKKSSLYEVIEKEPKINKAEEASKSSTKKSFKKAELNGNHILTLEELSLTPVKDKLLGKKTARQEIKMFKIALADYDINPDVEEKIKQLNYEIVDDNDLNFDLLLCDKLSKKIKILLAINKVRSLIK
jgi:hypothetical protein